MNAASVLDPMPDLEFPTNALDLGRPELAALMNRYVSNPTQSMPGLFNPPTALIVTRRVGQDAPVRAALENNGWFVTICAGPLDRGCPVMRGERCSVRESVDAAVVYIDPEGLRRNGMIPRLRCAADSRSPGLVALERRLDPPRYGHGVASVGALRNPDSVLVAISALLAGDTQGEGENHADHQGGSNRIPRQETNSGDGSVTAPRIPRK
jgi:hypothetical protein